MTFTCQHKTETFVRKSPTSVPGVAISAETHIHFGRNGYPFPRKRKSYYTERKLPEGSSSIEHQTLIGKRLGTTATFPRSTNFTLFYRVQSILYVQKREKATTTNCVIIAFSQILYPIYRILLCHSRNRYAVPCRLREYRTYATALGSDT